MRPVIATQPNWDPTLALIIAYLCAYEYGPKAIKSDLNTKFPPVQILEATCGLALSEFARFLHRSCFDSKQATLQTHRLIRWISFTTANAKVTNGNKECLLV